MESTWQCSLETRGGGLPGTVLRCGEAWRCTDAAEEMELRKDVRVEKGAGEHSNLLFLVQHLKGYPDRGISVFCLIQIQSFCPQHSEGAYGSGKSLLQRSPFPCGSFHGIRTRTAQTATRPPVPSPEPRFQSLQLLPPY